MKTLKDMEREGLASDWGRVRREAALGAPVNCCASKEAEAEPYDPNDALAAAAYWQSATIKPGRYLNAYE